MEDVPSLKTTELILLRASEVCKLCGCSERTWRDWDHLGYVPKPIVMRRTKYWVREELLAWARARCPKRDTWKYRPD